MGRFDTIKTTIDANIKENGSQEITGQKMNSILTEMVNATDAELTELSWEKGSIGSNGEVDESGFFRSTYIPCKVGDVITAYIFRVRKYDENLKYIGEEMSTSTGWDLLNHTISDENCKFVRITIRDYPGVGTQLLINGTSAQCILNKRTIEMLDATKKTTKDQLETLSVSIFSNGYWQVHGITDNQGYMHTCQFKCKKGDLVTGSFFDIRLFAEDGNYIGGINHSQNGITIENDSAKYACINLCKEDVDVANLKVNGTPIIAHILEVNFRKESIPALYPLIEYKLENIIFETLIPILQIRHNVCPCVKGLWVKNKNEGSEYYLTGFRYRQQSAEWGNSEFTQFLITEKKSNGDVEYHKLIDDRTSTNINDALQVVSTQDFELVIDWRLAKKGEGNAVGLVEGIDALRLDTIVFHKNNSIYLLHYSEQSTGGNTGENTGANLSSNPYIAMPLPQLAMVNIKAGRLPTTKTDDILATLEFNDMQGNVFAKKIIMNAQGTSSLGLPKKNISIDIVDENYEESHEIKFGDWVAQDGFHLKAYMLDGVRVKPMAAYNFYESMLLTRGVRKDRAWKRLQLPVDIPMASNEISDSYLQIDDGAKNHPSGFPIILYFNGVFYGIYCWQLKKHRANYHQKKSKAEHIHLDGNISNVLLWEANGVLDWDKWSGRKQESETSDNRDGIEVRNPKKLILTNGTEYDAETNPGELISSNSAGYNPTNADMARTAAVRASIESLSRRVYSLTQMAKGASKKSAIAEVFDVESIIDYIIFSQITGNIDGYKKNWQWVTYDGVKWAVNAYDLDGTWGWTSWNFYAPYTSWIHNDTPPVTLVIENYLDEIKARYKELRDKGVIELAKIMQPLVNYVKVIGIDYYDMEYEKWTDGARDNLWRFESWMEESIKRTDVLMGYNS